MNPLVYGLRIPEYRETFLRLVGLRYMIPARDSIELDSHAIKNSPGSFGGLTNGSVNSHGNNQKESKRTENDDIKCYSSLPVITITTTSVVITRSKSQDLVSSPATI